MILTTEQLVASVKRRTLAPSSQKTFQDADIIALLNEELELKLVPDILSVREDYFLASKRTPIVADVETYLLPERAIGTALKNVFYIGTDAISKTDLMRFKLQDLVDYAGSTGVPAGYLVQGDYLRVLPVSAVSLGQIEMWYLQRPSQLVATTACGKITDSSSAAGTTTFVVDTDLTATVAVGDSVDFLNSQSPTILWAQDVVVTAVTISSISVATADVVNAAGNVLPGIADYICLAKTANVPQIPQEFHPLLAEQCAARMIQALGHNDKLAAINVSLTEMKMQAMKLISNRVEDDPRTATTRRGISGFFGGSR